MDQAFTVPVRRLLMDMMHIDWLPLRFWLAALSSTAIMLLGLLAVGAIDDGTGDDVGVTALLRDANAAQCRPLSADLTATAKLVSPQ